MCHLLKLQLTVLQLARFAATVQRLISIGYQTDAFELTESVSVSDLLIVPFRRRSPCQNSEKNTLVNSSPSSTPKFLAKLELAVSWEF